MTTNTYSLLQTIDDPADLRRLSRAELKTLAQQLRAYVLDSVSTVSYTHLTLPTI